MPEVSHVESDLHCIRCGHNLRTLAWDARCTECGAPVEQSRVPEYLNVNDRRSLQGLRTALALIVVWIVAHRATLLVDWYGFGAVVDRYGLPFTPLFWLISWIPVVIYAIALFLLVRIAIRTNLRRALIVLAVVPVVLQVLIKLILWTNSSFPSSIRDASWDVIHFLVPMAYAGYAIPFLLIFLWLMGLFEFRGRRFDRVLLVLGTSLAAILVILTWLDVTHLLDSLIGSGHARLYSLVVTAAFVVIALVLIVFRGRIPKAI